MTNVALSDALASPSVTSSSLCVTRALATNFSVPPIVNPETVTPAIVCSTPAPPMANPVNCAAPVRLNSTY